MGQLSAGDAASYREKLANYLKKCKSQVRENFNEMDFENADKRTQMETHIVSMENKYDSIINELNNMSFE
ncbi:hypothetical protein CIY_00740 [Butyrivibrio fibrisolvens 16/4]|nr:hypothetical protein CIY_00740 [Butyrivibrio fibrisolvens 16/4]